MDGETATDGGGAYWRDAQGTWRYANGDDPVPGARDLRLADLYAPPLAADAATDAAAPDASDAPVGAVRLVPRAWASRHPDHPLAWIYAYATLGARDDVAVPAAAWDERAGTVVAMAAPELHPHNLMGVDGVAALLGVSPSTVRAYAARHQMPEPMVRLGGSPLWPRALIERWLPSRRRSGHAASDGVTAAADDVVTDEIEPAPPTAPG